MLNNLKIAAIIVLHRLSYTQAFSFTPNCTLPPYDTIYVSAPTVRSTLSIVWECLGILFLCTWSIQHLNVPEQRKSVKGFCNKFKVYVHAFLGKAKWAGLALIALEYLLGRAMAERKAAKDGVRRLQECYNNRVRALREKLEDLKQPSPELSRLLEQGAPSWEIAHVYMANAGFFVLDTGISIPRLDRPFKINEALLRGRYWALNCRQWQKIAVENDYVDLPNIEAAVLERLDHKSALVTILAVLQITTHIAQLVTRTALGLPSTPLEIGTLAFAALSAVIYVIYWDRPQGIEVIHESKLDFDRLPPPGGAGVTIDDVNVEKSFKLYKLRNELMDLGHTYLFQDDYPSVSLPPQTSLDERPIPIPNHAIPVLSFGSELRTRTPWRGSLRRLGPSNEISYVFLTSAFGGLIFGGLHILPIDSSRVVPIESIIWLSSSCVIAVWPFLMLRSSFVVRRHFDNRTFHANSIAQGQILPTVEKISRSPLRVRTMVIEIAVLYIPYLLARGYLLIAMFRTLVFLSPISFENTWAALLPHWG
ncbi:hypothetical protein TWF106_002499 [Orbilia oligospora]|uniref:Uncharacterized protein n=2 Tax=Orbilia oligospora TaxID=2813651 RepID=A0A7C8UY18_ORBOL|nr:hypothetical protein TWF106_002499 [Orbilia oligospora]